jgi:hypothetical protein
MTATSGRPAAGQIPGTDSLMGVDVYHKPAVVRFGTLRELTRTGFQGTTDGVTVQGNVTGSGCTVAGPGQTGSPPYEDLICPRS